MEAAWGRPDAPTGKLDPDTVGSPRKVEVVIRGNPIAAEPKKMDVGKSGSGGEEAGSAVAASMDETQ